MSILEIVHLILENKLLTSHTDYIDIRFTREQAEELYETIHRIITYDKNMKERELKEGIIDNYGSYT